MSGPVSSRLQQLAGEPGLSDAELLDRLPGEPRLFDALVRRHAALVWRVCRRQLGDEHEAEDAFQATFLILLGKASKLRREPLGPWLYGVAVRVALRARQRLRRRRQHQGGGVEAMARAEPSHDAGSDLRPVLDEEIARLPARDRRAVVLFHLEGKSAAETAQLMGCSEGSLRVRLNRARQRLGKRLARRGLGCTPALLAAALTPDALAQAPPAPLVQATIAALAASSLGPNVRSLAQEVLKQMWYSRIKLISVVCLALGLLGATGLVALSHQSDEPEVLARAVVPDPNVAQPNAKGQENGLSVKTDKDNVVGSRLEGSWEPDPAINKRLAAPGQALTVDFKADAEIVKQIPAKYGAFLKGKQIFLAGTMTLKGTTYPFVLVEHKGNPHVVYFRAKNGDPLGDAESFNVMLARGKEAADDLLFIGGDFNNQPFSAFQRSKPKQ